MILGAINSILHDAPVEGLKIAKKTQKTWLGHIVKAFKSNFNSKNVSRPLYLAIFPISFVALSIFVLLKTIQRVTPRNSSQQPPAQSGSPAPSSVSPTQSEPLSSSAAPAQAPLVSEDESRLREQFPQAFKKLSEDFEAICRQMAPISIPSPLPSAAATSSSSSSAASSSSSSSVELPPPVEVAFLDEVTRFENHYKRVIPIFEKIDNFNELKQQISLLINLRQHYREIVSSYYTSEGADADGIVEQPADGNCWLHAALYCLKDLNKLPLEYCEILERDRHIPLRATVANWMTTHYDKDKTLRQHIQASVMDYQDVKNMQLSNEENEISLALTEGTITHEEAEAAKVRIAKEKTALANIESEQYLAMARENGFHGSRAELYAISQLFHVDVIVWRQLSDGGIKNFGESILSVKNDGAIQVVLNPRGNHFNARIEAR